MMTEYNNAITDVENMEERKENKKKENGSGDDRGKQ